MNKKLWRIMDANINRASEGLRVVEDLARFKYEDKKRSLLFQDTDSQNRQEKDAALRNTSMQERIKLLRHELRSILDESSLIFCRDVKDDPGRKISFAYADLPENVYAGQPENPERAHQLYSKATQIPERPDQRDDELSLIHANFKRVQEALRTLEEICKMEVGYNVGKHFEKLRFQSYQLESDYHKRIWQLKFIRGVYGITHDTSSVDPVDQIERMIRCNIKVIQYRDKSSNPMPEERKRVFRRLSHKMRDQGIVFIVNDDWRLALELDACGVHFGQEDLQQVDISQIPKHILIGISTHNPDQVTKAKAIGADYIGVGPVFETKTKKNVEKSDGLKFLKWVSQQADIPYVAIGGISVEKLPQLRENGLAIAAMISAISETKNDNDLIKLVEQFQRKVK